MSPSTSWKVGMSGLDQDQAETEVASSRLEQDREDASAERMNQKEHEEELEDQDQAETEVASSRLEQDREDASAERMNQKEHEEELEDQDQAETEGANSQLEQEREDASAEEDTQVIPEGVTEGTIEDDPHIKAQSLEMENIATTDTTTHPLARQIPTTITTNVTATDTVHEKLEPESLVPKQQTVGESSEKFTSMLKRAGFTANQTALILAKTEDAFPFVWKKLIGKKCQKATVQRLPRLREGLAKLDLSFVTSGGVGSEALNKYLNQNTNYSTMEMKELHDVTAHLGSPIFNPIVRPPTMRTIVMIGDVARAIASMDRVRT
jgi:hypothetical protein